MNSSEIQRFASFLKTIRSFETTYRQTPKSDGTMESDAEHSWSVALITMLLASRIESELDVKIDQAKLLKMALIHDLAEIETGDTATWDIAARENKEEKERVAVHHLIGLLPEDLGRDLLALWEECEKRETIEAKIVKSIDRLDPVVHRVSFNIGWKGIMEEKHATIQALDERQLPRHEFSKTITALYEAFREEGKEKGMFVK